MNIDNIRCIIINKRLKSETYESIAKGLGISRALVRYIETHENYHPSRRVGKLLGIRTADDYTVNRRKRLDSIAVKWGYPSWCAYETYILKENDEQI